MAEGTFMKILKRSLKILVYTVLILYALVFISACAFQERLIFHPSKLPSDYVYQLPPNAYEVNLPTKDHVTVNGIFFEENVKYVILYLHGNAGDLSSWQHISENFTSKQTSFLVIDYRGYGKSSEKITEAGLYEDAQTAYNFLLTKGYTEDRIIVYGRSIGTGVATNLAKNNSPAKLILECPYSSLTALAKEKAPLLFPQLILKFRFNSLKNLQSIYCPILFIHGKKDTFINYEHSVVLYNSYKGKKELVLLEDAGHNGLPAYKEYHKAINSFIHN